MIEPDEIMAMLARRLRERLARGETVAANLQAVMDGLMPGWREG